MEEELPEIERIRDPDADKDRRIMRCLTYEGTYHEMPIADFEKMIRRSRRVEVRDGEIHEVEPVEEIDEAEEIGGITRIRTYGEDDW